MRPHWQNPEVTGYGRLPAHAGFTHPEEDCLSLSGTWQFARFDRPESIPGNWQDIDGQDIDWQESQVPGLWTMDPAQEDKPIYTNVRMPFRGEPPLTPALNPTAIYRRTIDVPKGWLGSRLVLQVGGVESCYFLYCNGAEIGFAKDSRLPSEFELQDHLHEGSNEIALVVIRYSDASFVEDQDQWRHAGIHRDIFLYRTPDIHIQDVFARPAYNWQSGQGALSVDVRLGDRNRSSLHHRVEVQLTDTAGRDVYAAPLSAVMEKSQFYPVTGKGPVLTVQGKPRKVKGWTAETPCLYTLSVTLSDPAGNQLQAVRLRIGFRDIRIEDRQLLVNGEAVLIRGVNRHDHCDTTGKIMTEALIRKDIVTMKQHNIDAIRTSHYPNDPMFYDLCDELGMYVVDEANLEAHHHYARLGQEPEWSGQFLSRGMRMVERDKNHACIIMWSAGNETGFGPNHMAMTAWIRQYDPSRPIHNENAICEQRIRDMWDENHHGTDVVCPMYPSVDQIIAHARDSDDPRPLIMCEYAHAMGNSCGNLKEYWDAIETWHGLQGGFIWEWLDHGILSEANGIPYWAYGGDFGEEQHDLNFVCDGLCWPDRTPHSSLIEYKKIIQPVAIRRLRGNRFELTNKHHFTDLSGYSITWTLLRDGVTVRKGQLPRFNTGPQYIEEFELDLPLRDLPSGGEKSVIFDVRLAHDTDWAEAGHLVAWDQVELGGRRTSAALPSLAPTVTTSGNETHVRQSRATLVFDTHALKSLQVADETIESPLMLNLWRAPMDNDGIKGWEGQETKALGLWQAAGLDQISWQHRIKHARDTRSGFSVRQSSEGHCTAGIVRVVTDYLVTADQLAVNHKFAIPRAFTDLPRVGVRWTLPDGFEGLHWYGRGPHETYCDRLTSGQLRVHESSVSEQYVPYILPQEHGNLTDTRWLSVSRHDLAIRFEAEDTFEASATHYPQEMLTPAFHTYELAPQQETFVCLDVRQRGVGGASCGPDTLPQYRIGPGKYELAYRITFGAADD